MANLEMMAPGQVDLREIGREILSDGSALCDLLQQEM